MKKVVLAAFAFLCAWGVFQPAPAVARVFVRAGIGCCYGGYYPYGYPAYYAPYYVAPPPVVYSVPAAPVYAYSQQPAPAAMAGPPPDDAPVSNQSETFIDPKGRTCRQYQTTSTGSSAACLMPDGTWHAVKE